MPNTPSFRPLRRLPLVALALVLALPAGLTAQEGGRPTAILVSGPEPGRRAPNFTLPAATKEQVLAEPVELFRTRGQPVVLAFYPRDFTKTCTAEWQAFVEQADSLFGEGVVVLGISADSVETHQRFAASLNAPFLFLSDTAQTVARAYGSRGSTPGYNRRTIYVIGADGRVVWRDLKFNALDPKAYDRLAGAVRRARR